MGADDHVVGGLFFAFGCHKRGVDVVAEVGAGEGVGFGGSCGGA